MFPSDEAFGFCVPVAYYIIKAQIHEGYESQKNNDKVKRMFNMDFVKTSMIFLFVCVIKHF